MILQLKLPRLAALDPLVEGGEGARQHPLAPARSATTQSEQPPPGLRLLRDPSPLCLREMRGTWPYFRAVTSIAPLSTWISVSSTAPATQRRETPSHDAVSYTHLTLPTKA